MKGVNDNDIPVKKPRSNRKSGMTEEEYTEKKVCYNCKHCTRPTSDKIAYCLHLKEKVYDIYETKCISGYEFVELIQCNVCGMYFRSLVSHVKVHHITLAKYKEREGYNRRTALCCKTTRDMRSDVSKKNWNVANRYLKNGSKGKSWNVRAEGKLNFENAFLRRGGVAYMIYISSLKKGDKNGK